MRFFLPGIVAAMLAMTSIAQESGVPTPPAAPTDPAEFARQARKFRELEAAQKEAAARELLLSQVFQRTDNRALYDVKYYGIHIDLSFLSESAIGQVDYQIVSTSHDLGVIELDLHTNLTVDSARVGALPAAVARADSLVHISLPQPADSGAVIDLSVFYHGQPFYGNTYDDGGMEFTTYHGNDVIFTSTEPFDSRNWFPCKDTPEDKADSIDVWVAVPEPLYAVSNGKLISIADYPGDKRQFHWQHRYPIVTYLIVITAAEFVVDSSIVNLGSEAIPVYNFSYPNSLESRTTFNNYAAALLQHYSNAFGAYPFADEKLGNANAGTWSTMEHQTCSTHDPWGGYDMQFSMIHENAHQWWGDMITCRTFHDIWLNEGFATWSEAIFQERQNQSFSAYLSFMKSLQPAQFGTLYVEDPLTQMIFDGSLAYDKGAWVVHMLRGVLGDSTFFDVLQQWAYSEFRYASASSADLEDFFSERTGVDLGYFFNQWVYYDGYPTYRKDWVCRYDPLRQQYRLDYEIRQIQLSTPTFRMPIQHTLITSSGNRDTVIWQQGRSQLYTIWLEDSISAIALDPTNWILRDSIIYNVPITLSVLPLSCPEAIVGEFYELQMDAVGLTPPYSISFLGGDLPYGIELNTQTQRLEGRPTLNGTFFFTLQATDSHVPPHVVQRVYQFTVLPALAACGDPDASGVVSISDAVYLINYIFASGPPPVSLGSADVDCNGLTTISDAVYLISYIFSGGPAPCAGCP